MISGLNSIGKELNAKLQNVSSRQPPLKFHNGAAKKNYILCNKDFEMNKSKLTKEVEENSIEINSINSNHFNSVEYLSNKGNEFNRLCMTSEDINSKHKYWMSAIKSDHSISKGINSRYMPIKSNKIKSKVNLKGSLNLQPKSKHISNYKSGDIKFNSPLSQFLMKHCLTKSKKGSSITNIVDFSKVTDHFLEGVNLAHTIDRKKIYYLLYKSFS